MEDIVHVRDLFPVLRASLIKHEGYSEDSYKDTKGNWTIGVGHLLGKGEHFRTYRYGKDKIEKILYEDMSIAINDCYHIFESYNTLPFGVRLALADMAFNLGRPNLKKFKKMIAAIDCTDWIIASDEMLDSKWARQVGSRADYLAELVEGHSIC